MVKKVAIGLLSVLAAMVLVFVIVVAMQPSKFRIVRSTTITASPAEVFPHVNDFHKWQAWSPWIALDPKATATFEGPSEGKDAVFGWSGNDDIGEGKMTIVESKPHEQIDIRLDFVRPMAGTSNAQFSFEPEGESTKVTWAMTGENNFIGRAMCMIMDMDEMVGSKFEEGLASMKKAVESGKPSEQSEDKTNPTTGEKYDE